MAHIIRWSVLLVVSAAFPSFSLGFDQGELCLLQISASTHASEHQQQLEQDSGAAPKTPDQSGPAAFKSHQQGHHRALSAKQFQSRGESRRLEPPASFPCGSNNSGSALGRSRSAFHPRRQKYNRLRAYRQRMAMRMGKRQAGHPAPSPPADLDEEDEQDGSVSQKYVVAGGISGAVTATLLGAMVAGPSFDVRSGIATSIVGGVMGSVTGFMISGGTSSSLASGSNPETMEQAEPYTEKLHQLAYTIMAITAELENSEEAYNATYKAEVHKDLEEARVLLNRIEQEISQGLHATKDDFHELEEILSHGKYSQFLTAEAAAANEEVLTANDAAVIEAEDDVDGAVHPEDMGPAGDLDSYEGDMVPANYSQRELFEKLTLAQISGNSTGRFAGEPWAGGQVYYCYAPDVSIAVQHVVWAAMRDIENAVPCIKFVKVGHRTGTSYDHGSAQACQASPAIFIQSNRNEGCYSYVGMIASWPSQKLQLQDPGCVQIGTAVHELGHALGMAHEQARPDRDNHVTIQWPNVKNGMEHNFEIANKGFTRVPYDFLSVMHYDAFAFAANKRQPTILDTKNPGHSPNEEGQRIGLANSDITQLEAMYSTVAESSCYTNKVAGMGCLDKPDQTGRMFCSGLSQCTAGAVTHCCACGGGVQVQCYANQACPSAQPLPPPPGGECLVDKSNLFPQPSSGCVFTNICDFKVKWKCPGKSCTHTTPPGGFWQTDCGGQKQTDVCIPGACDVWQA